MSAASLTLDKKQCREEVSSKSLKIFKCNLA